MPTTNKYVSWYYTIVHCGVVTRQKECPAQEAYMLCEPTGTRTRTGSSHRTGEDMALCGHAADC
eukprot:scaffold149732_cov31-Prasinocladus_malaysianus.AAC.1